MPEDQPRKRALSGVSHTKNKKKVCSLKKKIACKFLQAI